MFSRISICRDNDDGEPDPEGQVEVHFFGDDGKIVAAVYLLKSGAVCAHAIKDGKFMRALLNPGETEA
jgi:hypothetical protein